MSEQSLEEILNQLRDERVACEQVLASVHGLAAGELKGVFDKAIILAKLEAQVAEPQVSDEIKEIITSATSQIAFVSSQMESATVLLEKRTEELKRFQRRCITLGGIYFALAFSCSMFIGWTGYSYWFIKAIAIAMIVRTPNVGLAPSHLEGNCTDPGVGGCDF